MNAGPLAAAIGAANGTDNAAAPVIATTAVLRSDFTAMLLQVAHCYRCAGNCATCWKVGRSCHSIAGRPTMPTLVNWMSPQTGMAWPAAPVAVS